jgi:putative transposase
MTSEPATYPGYRFPAEIISHAIWLYHLFGLSFRDIELILAERSIVVSHESIRQWCLKFGSEFARRLRRRRPKPGDTWCQRRRQFGALCRSKMGARRRRRGARCGGDYWAAGGPAPGGEPADRRRRLLCAKR